jgi:hypothetical protein
VIFAGGDWLLSRGGGGERKDSAGAQAAGAPLAIVLGSILDGIPESFVLGLAVLQGGVSISLLAGVVLFNASVQDASDGPSRPLEVPVVDAVIADLAAVGSGEPDHHPHGGRLPGAVSDRRTR